MMNKRYKVTLRQEERRELEVISTKGVHPEFPKICNYVGIATPKEPIIFRWVGFVSV